MPESPVKILLVDDDKAILSVTEQVLKLAGYEVRLAQDGAEALTRMRADRPDLVLLDVNLPDMSGHEICRQIKSDAELGDTFVIQISAISIDSDSQAQGLDSGADGYIVRPIANRELLARIQSYVRIKIAEKKLKEYSRRLEEMMMEHKWAETILQESEVLLRTMAENYPNSYISIIEKDLSIGFTSGQEFKKQNLDPRQFVGVNLEQIFGEHTSFVRENYLKTFEGAETQFELFINDQYLYYRTVPLVNSDGEINKIMVVVENITERKQAEESNRRYSEQLSIVADIEHSLVSPLAQESIWDILLAGMQRLFPDVAGIFISRFDVEREMIQAVRAVQDGNMVDVSELPEIPLAPEGQGTQSKVIRTHQPLIIDTDLAKKLYLKKVIASSNEKETLSALYVPMLAQDKILGLVQCQSYLPCRFAQDDVKALSLIANTAAVSIQNARLFEMAQTEIAERKLTEEKLTHLSQRHELILSSVAEGILGLDLNGYHTFVNPSAAKMLGYEVEELIGKPSHSIWHHTKLDGSSFPLEECKILGSYREGIEVHVHSEVFWRKNSTSFPVEYTSTPTYEHGKLMGAVVTFTDITERKQAEKALKESEMRLATIFRSNPAAIAITQLDNGLLIDVNEAWQDFTGYKHSEVIGHTPLELNMWIDPKQREHLVEMAREQGYARSEVQLRRKSGQIYDLLMSAELIEVTGKAYLLTMAQDITERKRAEEDLRASEQTARRTAEQLRIVNQIGIKITTDLDFERLVETIYEQCQQIGATDTFYIAFYNGITGMLSFPFCYKDGERKIFASRNLRETPGLAGYIIEHRQTLYLPDTSNLPPGLTQVRQPGTINRSFIGIPLILKDRVVGILSMQSHSPNAYSPEQIQTIELIVTQIAVAIQNAQLYRQARQEINERKLAEEALRASEANYRNLVETSESAIAVLDRNGKILYSNPRGIRFWDDPQIVGKTIFDIYPREYAERYKVAIQKVIDTQTGILDETQSLIKNRLMWFRLSMQPMHNSDGKVDRLLLNALDITEKIQSANQLMESETRFRQLAENIEEVFWMFDYQQKKFVYVSPAYEKIWGTSVESLYQDDTQRIKAIHLDDQAKMFAILDLQACGHRTEFEYRMVRPDGSIHWIWDRSFPIFDESGKLVRTAGVATDITERKQANEEMQQRVTELEMLYESGLAFSQLLHPKQIGQKIIELLEKKLDWHHTVIRLYDPQKGILDLLAFSQPDLKDEEQRRAAEEHLRGKITAFGEGLSGWAVQNHQGVRSGSVDHDPRYKESYAGMRSGLYVPMQSIQNVVGVISIESEKPDAFTAADQRLATTLANQAAVAIENARLNASLEQRVKERTAEVEDLYNNAPTGYHSLDENGTFTMVNQTQLDWLGYTREELVRIKKFRDLTTLQSQPVFDKNFPIFKAQGWVKNLEFELIRKDGSTFPVLLNATAIYDTNGKYLHSRSTMFDITDRRRAEEAARKLSQAVEYSPASVIITNRDGIIEYVNPMFCEVTGYTREETFGQTQAILKSGIHTPEYYESVWATLLAGQPWRGEFCNKRKNGEFFWVYTSISPVRNEYGEITHYVEIQEDITERKKVEEALRESRDKLSAANAALEKAARLKDEFLASMSHELRTPLTGILGLSEALQLKTYGELNSKQITAVTTIQESGRHLLELINDILDLSKIEAGKLELQFAPCFVADICQASLQLIKGMAHQKKQNVTYTPLTQSVFVRADARRLKQILVNLLSNAVKFTPEGGELGLEAWANESERAVKIIVWDKGIGIKPEDLQKLFKPFTQLDSSLSREYSGTGLGLSLVKRLTEMHNGGIEVSSVLGEGSCFTVTLPWSPNNTTPVPYRSAAKGSQPLVMPDRSHSPTVLIADDNEIVLQMMADFLEMQRYYVIKARNGFELLDLAAEFHPKVILVDIQMPGMDGLEAIRRIRAHADPFVAAAYVIVITAMAMSGDRERSLLAGANEYLSKPVRLKELAAILQRQIEKK